MADKIFTLYSGAVVIEFKEANHSYWKVEKDGKKRRLTGVTTFMKVLDKPALVPWAVNTAIDNVRERKEELQSAGPVAFEEILESAKNLYIKKKDEAADLGSIIHNWCEDYIKGKNPVMPEDPQVTQGVLSFLEWVEHSKVKFASSERIIYSQKYDYVGTLDAEATIGGKLYLIDFKTSNGIYPETRLQTAAYQWADQEERGVQYEGRWILRLSKETKKEYDEKMAKKALKYNGRWTPPEYKIFEAVYLDHDKKDFHKDIKAFLACQQINEWQKTATLQQ